MRHQLPHVRRAFTAAFLIFVTTWLAPLLAAQATPSGVTIRAVYGLGALRFAGGSKALETALPFEGSLIASLRAGGDGPDLGTTLQDSDDTEHSWRELQAGGALCALDLDELFGTLSPAVAYLWIRVESTDGQPADAWFGSDDGLRLWLDGKLLVDAPVARGLNSHEHLVSMPLVRGTNHILAKVGQDGGAWGFQMELAQPMSVEAKTRLQPAINGALDRGLEYLLACQEPDGSWRQDQDKYINGQTALSLFTLLKCGLSSDHEAVQRARLWLTQNPPVYTYSCAVQMMAFAELRDPSLDDQLRSMASSMTDWQTSTGWAYPDSHVDLSNHQFALLGLAAAAERGIKIRPKVWNTAVDQALRWQKKDGGFAYKSDRQPTGSMTAAGLTTIGVCRRELLRIKKLPIKKQRAWDAAAERGIDWLAEHWNPGANPAPSEDKADSRWYPYYMYGVERVGAFFGRSHLGDVDWYWEGARALVAKQKDDGEWATNYGEDQPGTCFALLFLKRATAALSGGSNAKARGWGEKNPTADVQLRGSGRGPVAVWLTGLGKAARSKHSWPADQRGGVRVRRVEYLVDGQIAATVDGDPTQPMGVARYPAKLTGLEPGEHVISARVWLYRHDADEDHELLSAKFTITVAREAAPWMRDYALDRTKNLIAEARFKLAVSSEDGDKKFAQKLLVDNLMGTGWLSKKDDTKPWITLDFKKPLKANVLVLSHTRPKVREPEGTSLVKLVRVTINGKKKQAHTFELDLDPLRKSVFEFGKLQTIRKLRIEVLDHQQGERRSKQVGFAEIELRRER